MLILIMSPPYAYNTDLYTIKHCVQNILSNAVTYTIRLYAMYAHLYTFTPEPFQCVSILPGKRVTTCKQRSLQILLYPV